MQKFAELAEEIVKSSNGWLSYCGFDKSSGVYEPLHCLTSSAVLLKA